MNRYSFIFTCSSTVFATIRSTLFSFRWLDIIHVRFSYLESTNCLHTIISTVRLLCSRLVLPLIIINDFTDNHCCLMQYNVDYFQLPLAVNPSGCARTEPRFRCVIKPHRRHHQTLTSPGSVVDVVTRASAGGHSDEYRRQLAASGITESEFDNRLYKFIISL